MGTERDDAVFGLHRQSLVRITVFALAILSLFCLACCFVLTGADPLRLFQPAQQTATPEPTPLTSAGGEDGWWQVYFTEPATRADTGAPSQLIPDRLTALIDDAQQSVLIAAFEFDLVPVAEALIRARQRGLDVRWITDDENGLEADEEEGIGLFADLEKAGIEVRDDDRTALMHNKFIIIDGRTVWTGSTNITENGSYRNNNNVLIVESPEFAEIYEREFTEMWQGQFGPTSPTTISQQSLTIQGSPVRVLFAAEDEVISQLISLVDQAEQTIHFMAFSFTNDELGAALVDRAEQGVDVMGIFETRGSETEFSEYRTLFCAGLPVRQDGNPGTLHHKVFVIDGRTVVTGSMNFSDNADESNDENVVVVANNDMARRFLQEFDRRWAEAREIDDADVSCN